MTAPKAKVITIIPGNRTENHFILGWKLTKNLCILFLISALNILCRNWKYHKVRIQLQSELAAPLSEPIWFWIENRFQKFNDFAIRAKIFFRVGWTGWERRIERSREQRRIRHTIFRLTDCIANIFKTIYMAQFQWSPSLRFFLSGVLVILLLWKQNSRLLNIPKSRCIFPWKLN